MAGIPRPVTDLPDGSVSVRVIRGALTNNIAKQSVELHVGPVVLTAKTDDAGRAQFDKLTPGATVKAVAVVDGERLDSEEFSAPAQGGIRLLLVATDGSKNAKADASAPAVTGQVTIGRQSRIIMAPGDETVALYYVLDIVNNARTPVNPVTLFTFDMPTGAVGAGMLRGSSPLASVSGTHVRVQGPFPPGSTSVQIGCELPTSSGSLDLTQRFPAAVEQFALIVKKVGETKVSSPQLASQQETTSRGETFITGTGRAVAAGQPLTVSLTDMPHHSATPRRTALALALGIVLVGVWTSTRISDDPATRGSERKRLIARREKLLADLVRLERDQRDDPRDNRDDRYRARREEIIAALEQVYGALDSDGVTPGPGNTAGVAA